MVDDDHDAARPVTATTMMGGRGCYLDTATTISLWSKAGETVSPESHRNTELPLRGIDNYAHCRYEWVKKSKTKQESDASAYGYRSRREISVESPCADAPGQMYQSLLALSPS